MKAAIEFVWWGGWVVGVLCKPILVLSFSSSLTIKWTRGLKKVHSNRLYTGGGDGK